MSISKNILVVWLLIYGPIASALVQANDWPAFPADVDGRLFRVAGSNTVGANLMRNFLVRYFEAKGVSDIRVADLAAENEYRVQGLINGRPVWVDVAAHGSSTGFKALLSDAAELAMSSRPIKSKEVIALENQGDMLSFDGEHVVAIDGLAIVVHPQNAISALTLDQLAAVFSGKINNWSALGGDDRAINLYARDNNSGTWDTFKGLVLRKKVKLAASAERFESNDELSDRVSSDLGGIGFVGLASVRNSKALMISDEGTRALQPELVTVATEDYVLSRRLFVYSPPMQQVPFLREFISFMQSDAGQAQVQKTGFISQALIATSSEGTREGPEEYLTLTDNAKRLSANFRFSLGSSVLDNKALRDIQRVVDYMSRPENSDKKLFLVGFGDEKQSESRAKVLSKLRALQVRSALHKKGVNTAPVSGFGAFMPVAANSTQGKIKNRRVEVWVR